MTSGGSTPNLIRRATQCWLDLQSSLHTPDFEFTGTENNLRAASTKHPEGGAMQSILFVCLGNICRSPLAQGIFEHRATEMGCAREYDADSAGTSGWHEGEPPHSGSIRIAEKYGISIARQRSRPVHCKDAEIFHYIIAMDTSNRQSLIEEFRFPREKVYLMRDFSLKFPEQKGLSVPDPWGQGTDAFEEVFQILDDAITGFLIEIRK